LLEEAISIARSAGHGRLGCGRAFFPREISRRLAAPLAEGDFRKFYAKRRNPKEFSSLLAKLRFPIWNGTKLSCKERHSTPQHGSQGAKRVQSFGRQAWRFATTITKPAPLSWAATRPSWCLAACIDQSEVVNDYDYRQRQDP
jgi:hypothetical protein